MRRYLVKIAMQYGLKAQQIQSIDFDLLEKLSMSITPRRTLSI